MSAVERETERFQARADDGGVFTVVKIVQMTPFQPLEGPLQHLPGGYCYRLLDGSHVNQKNASTFEIFDTEQIIRKVE